MPQILALLQSIPKIISLVEKIANAWEQHKMSEMLNDIDQYLDKINSAKTRAEKLAALRGLIGIISR